MEGCIALRRRLLSDSSHYNPALFGLPRRLLQIRPSAGAWILWIPPVLMKIHLLSLWSGEEGWDLAFDFLLPVLMLDLLGAWFNRFLQFPFCGAQFYRKMAVSSPVTPGQVRGTFALFGLVLGLPWRIQLFLFPPFLVCLFLNDMVFMSFIMCSVAGVILAWPFSCYYCVAIFRNSGIPEVFLSDESVRYLIWSKQYD